MTKSLPSCWFIICAACCLYILAIYYYLRTDTNVEQRSQYTIYDDHLLQNYTHFSVNTSSSATEESSLKAEDLIQHSLNIKDQKRPLLLLWTGLTAAKPMWNFIDTKMFTYCPHKCEITNERRYLNQSSLVLFRLRNLKTVGPALRLWLKMYDVKDLPEMKYPNQVWVDMNKESPMFSHSDEELLPVDNSFDYFATYHSQSDFVYRSYLLHSNKTYPGPHINYAANKTKMALWYVSNCQTFSGRVKYAEELRKYNVTIDIIGKCSGKTDGCDKYDYKCIEKVRSQYKFYLAFENSICSEYITEKYWDTLNSASYNIPIALGAQLQEYQSLSPPDSFIHVRNFTGAKQLAQYLHTVNEDDAKFNSYHAWREKYELHSPNKEPFDCWVCRMAYEKPRNKNHSYAKYWSRKKMCDMSVEPESIRYKVL